MNEILTVFTPAYNRAYSINKCYESLRRQTNKKFKWLVVDDGSTDNTKELILKWKEEATFEINYIYKKNGGMHTAHNIAYENIDTELNVCIDSDDYMSDNAVEKIIELWKERKSNNIAGLAGLDIKENGDLIGTKFPPGLEESTLFDLYNKHGIKGDKKLVYRTDLTKDYKYPEFENEKYVGLDYKCHKIHEKYNLALVNEVFCIVEYLDDGSSKNMLNQYIKNPKGWCFYRLENLKIPNTSLKYKFKECVHYVSSSIISKNKRMIKDTPYKIMTILSLPIGIILYMYITIKTKEKKIFI